MKRVKLVIAYDGTNYSGWQVQPNVVTVESVINNTLSDLLQEDIKIIGASRTDSGVHALGNVAVFDTDSKIQAEKICYALNQRLPEDIRVQSSEKVPFDYHPRKIASTKTYEYNILNSRIMIPTKRLYMNFIYYILDVAAMQEAAGYLIGKHDFKSFCSIRTKVEDTVRVIYNLEITKHNNVIRISITGSGFLYNMVRIIVGTLIEVGRGAYPPDKMKEILSGCNRSLAGPTALARGLTLVKIEYTDCQID